MRINPEIEKVYGQLLWVERRRRRVLAAVASHFGQAPVARALANARIESPLLGEPTLLSLLDERSPAEFLSALAAETLGVEARTVEAVRKHVSAYREHVDEQVLFGVRTGAQEAGRAFMARAHSSVIRAERLEIPEAIQAVLELTYGGLPGEKNFFLSLRSHGGSTLHHRRSPLLEVWRAEGADPHFLHQLQTEWTRGILDILAPDVEYASPRALESGHAYGLAQFHLRGVHAEP